ncbi:hypothetical protein RND81_03G163800 [Saponaria officinalis]|uniref:Glutaredoxin domain-containing protein n=1 Tax=Saponaria officinalis TaxID=3572 RepID=A0AAW1M8M1_SAPOF
MLVQWRKRSYSTRVHTRSPSFADHHFNHRPPSPFHPSTTTPTTPFHKHSVSFKDIESLLSNSPTRSSSPSPAHLSLKDIHTLLSEPDDPTRDHPSIIHRAWAWARARRQARPPPNSKARVVVYYTSLRVVRRTYEDCRAVRSILAGYRIRIDERDLSMDGAYVEEVESVVGEKRDKVVKMLPLVYVNGKWIGGVDEIKRMHESGELKRVLQAVPAVKGGGYGGGGCCVCGGCRYVVCEYCDGSHKVFVDKIDGFRSCVVCNVNGLVKCPSCSSLLL